MTHLWDRPGRILHELEWIFWRPPSRSGAGEAGGGRKYVDDWWRLQWRNVNTRIMTVHTKIHITGVPQSYWVHIHPYPLPHHSPVTLALPVVHTLCASLIFCTGLIHSRRRVPRNVKCSLRSLVVGVSGGLRHSILNLICYDLCLFATKLSH